MRGNPVDNCAAVLDEPLGHQVVPAEGRAGAAHVGGHIGVAARQEELPGNQCHLAGFGIDRRAVVRGIAEDHRKGRRRFALARIAGRQHRIDGEAHAVRRRHEVRRALVAGPLDRARALQGQGAGPHFGQRRTGIRLGSRGGSSRPQAASNGTHRATLAARRTTRTWECGGFDMVPALISLTDTAAEKLTGRCPNPTRKRCPGANTTQSITIVHEKHAGHRVGVLRDEGRTGRTGSLSGVSPSRYGGRV